MMKQSLMQSVMSRVAGIAAIGLLTLGVFGSPQALAGIASTKHNLGSGGSGTNSLSSTAEICVFCHTPHGADTTAAVPLWNRKLAAATSYTTYNSLGTSSLDGATAPVGSVSIACLSCHDGIQAMNTMINAPGSGGYNAAGATFAGTWAGPALTADPVGSLNYATPGIVNIGQNLKNDHPIGIQYAGGPASGAAVSLTAFKDPDFNAMKTATLNGQSVWWVDTGGTGTREKTDMQLYTRTETAFTGGTTSTLLSTTAQPYVECASCHDPHSSNTTFLRIENTGSAVCLACHIK